ncbi:MAG TPA: SBBP repeat-containing protein, partial [Bacteroidia bacterium]|nr:SBBP repeat-containing protein [Bacteroidia bacterium]
MNKILLSFLFASFTVSAFATDIGFTENKGQFRTAGTKDYPANVLFRSYGTSAAMYVTDHGIDYFFTKKEKTSDDNSVSVTGWSRIGMTLTGADIRKENIATEDPLPGVTNYYLADCPQGITGVRSWHKVTIRNIYPGIDWVLTADNEKGVSHDFIVHPGADPALIRISYTGENLGDMKASDADLVFPTAYGSLNEGKLHVYEQGSGRVVPASFDILLDLPGCMRKSSAAHAEVSYAISSYSVNETLVIDPPLQWSSTQASTSADYGYATIAAGDGSGDVIVTGASDGTDFPVQNAYQGQLYGFEDMVVFRLDQNGNRLWSTYYGGTGDEQGKGIASDAGGNCYVTGSTGSNDFPTLNPVQPGYGGGVHDVAMLKLNGAGVRQWATWLGGLQSDNGTAITCDVNGNCFVTGYTNSSDFPVTPGAAQTVKNIGYDAFVFKMNSTGVVPWATFYGGDDDDKGRAIALDPGMTDLYFTGSTLAGGFPVTAGVFQNSSMSAYNAEDAFIVKMDTSQSVQFASYCGGSDADFGQGIAVDLSGNIFITGYTLSANFPVVNPGGGAYVDSTIGSLGTHDAFVVECNSSGTQRLWSTYFGGSSPDMSFAIAYEAYAGIYICGNTASTDFPVQMPSDNLFYQPTQGDGGNFNDKFIAWFGQNDSLEWATYYGGANDDEAFGVCTDANDNIFMAGLSNNDIDVQKFAPGFPLAVFPGNETQNDLSVYPNPAQQYISVTVNSQANENPEFQLMDLSGKIIRQAEAGPAGPGNV